MLWRKNNFISAWNHAGTLKKHRNPWNHFLLSHSSKHLTVYHQQLCCYQTLRQEGKACLASWTVLVTSCYITFNHFSYLCPPVVTPACCLCSSALVFWVNPAFWSVSVISEWMKDVLNPDRIFITKVSSSIFLFHLSAEGFIRMSASIVTHWGSSQEDKCLLHLYNLAVWKRRVKRYYKRHVNKTLGIPLQPSGFPRESSVSAPMGHGAIPYSDTWGP